MLSRPQTAAFSPGVAGLYLLALFATDGLAQRALGLQDPPRTTSSQAPGTGAGERLVPIHTAAPDGGVEYGIWAAGPGFKVSFHEGATFVPMLGKHYPHNQPLRWRTVSARIGERELVTQDPQLSYQGLRAEYDLGAVVEAYDVGDTGVEQTFVIAASPGGGDLVIRGVVDSMLQTGDVPAAHQSLAFVDAEGRHLVSYGKATAVDADGRAVAMTTSFQNGEITLQLDAGFLANATYPVVVDPLLGLGTQVSGFTVRDEVDLVCESEPANGGAWVSTSLWASANDRDLYWRRFAHNGLFLIVIFGDVTANWSSQGARCASSAGADHSVMVFDRHFTSSGVTTRRLRYHRRARDDFHYGTTVAPIFSTDNAWRCDVGGTEQGASGPEVLVVWQQESNQGGAWQNDTGSGIRGCMLNLSGGFHGPIFPISTSSLGDEERPSVNEFAAGTDPNNAHWLVAYQTYSNLSATDDWDVGLRQVDRFGSVTGAMFLDNASSDHKMSPIVAGMGSRYLVAFASSTQAQLFGKPMDPEGHKIRTVRVDWDPGAASGSEPYARNELYNGPTRRALLADVAFDHETQSHWGALYFDRVAQRAFFSTCGYLGRELDGAVVDAGLGTDTLTPGGLTYDELEDQFTIGYGYNYSSGGSWVALNRWGYSPVTPWSTSGTGCSPATIAWHGSQHIGAELGSVEVSGAAADSLHVVLLATGPFSLQLTNISPIQNGCWLLLPNAGPQYLGTFGLQVGANASFPLPLPDFLGAGTVYFQDFHTVGGGALEFVSTSRLEVPIVR